MMAGSKRRSVIQIVSVIVVAIAICIGIINKVRPELFFRVPKIGFILWAVTGNQVPPYFDSKIYTRKYFHQWAEDGDCILASLPKAGTIWLHNILIMLKNGGDDDFINGNMFNHFGVAEMLRYPEHTIDIRIEETRQTRKRHEKTAIFDKNFTHFAHICPSFSKDEKDYMYGLDNKQHPNIKYIVAMRNPKDSVKSFYTFVNNHVQGFRDMWGGFPPRFEHKEQVVDFAIANKGFLFNPIIAWWTVRHDPNVILINFADLKSNLRKEVERIANFLNLNAYHEIIVTDEHNNNITKPLMDIILHKASFKYMKAKEIANPGYYGATYGRPGEAPKRCAHEHINKGVVGGADDFFTPEMDEIFSKEVEHSFHDYPGLKEWLKEGGPY